MATGAHGVKTSELIEPNVGIIIYGGPTYASFTVGSLEFSFSNAGGVHSRRDAGSMATEKTIPSPRSDGTCERNNIEHARSEWSHMEPVNDYCSTHSFREVANATELNFPQTTEDIMISWPDRVQKITSKSANYNGCKREPLQRVTKRWGDAWSVTKEQQK